MEKDKYVALIKARIESEFRKHKDIDWAEIAAQKIYADVIASSKSKRPSMIEVMEELQLAIKESSAFGLETEVIASAMMIMKDDPSLNEIEAIEVGLTEWIK